MSGKALTSSLRSINHHILGIGGSELAWKIHYGFVESYVAFDFLEDGNEREVWSNRAITNVRQILEKHVTEELFPMHTICTNYFVLNRYLYKLFWNLGFRNFNLGGKPIPFQRISRRGMSNAGSTN